MATSMRGGARKGAGRKPADYVMPKERADYEEERALHEKSKRERSELAYQLELGEVVSRQAVQVAAATAFAMTAQSLRSLSDNLERKLGLDPAVAEQIELTVDAVLTDLSLALEALHAPKE